MSYEQRVRRRGELARFLDNEWDGKILDAMMEKERKQQVAQMACRAIGYHLERSVQHAAWVRYGSQIA
jgi:hypothetical protein